jgi:hypothetical protein
MVYINILTLANNLTLFHFQIKILLIL